MFAPGLRDVYFPAKLGFFDGEPLQVTFTRPDGSVALDVLRELPLQGYRATWVTRREHLNLDHTGSWRLRLASNGQQLANGPFRVAATASSRRPNPVTPSLDPAAPTRDDVIQCLVHTSP